MVSSISLIIFEEIDFASVFKEGSASIIAAIKISPDIPPIGSK